MAPFSNEYSRKADSEKLPPWSSELAPQHDSFKIVEQRYKKNFDFLYTVYQHKNTEMQVVSIGSNDPLDVEEGFAFYVKTLPETDEGIPHILEHTVLSSSYKYKNPFSTLLRGGLHTLLNAYTYPDKTIYLARSMNTKDFFNILGVYMDCVFRPSVLEDRTYFDKEGWTYLLKPLTEEEKKDESIPKIDNYKVSYNGIVYSEMKGSYSKPTSILYYESMKLLFPNNIYSKSSGGDPEIIPNLTYESFKRFYYKNYSPKKIKLFVSSNKSAKKVLDFVDEYVKELDFSKYHDTEVEKIKLQTYEEGPFYYIKKYANSSEKKESMVLVSWVLNPIKKNSMDIDLSMDLPLDSFVLSVVKYLLLKTPSSVLHKALIDSGLGTNILVDIVDDEYVQQVFSVGLKGIYENDETSDGNDENTPEIHYVIEKLIIDTLQKVVDTGFNKELIDVALNYIEFQLKESNLSTAKGTLFSLEIISKLNIGEDPLEAFEYDKYLKIIKNNVNTIPNYLENFVKKHLINNKHRAVLLLKGDENIGKSMALKEQCVLKNRLDQLTNSEKKKIVSEFKKMENETDSSFNMSDENIPLLNISDLNEKTLEIPVTVYFTNSQKKNDFEEYNTLASLKEKVNNNLQFFIENYVLRGKKSNTENIEDIHEGDIPLLIHEVETSGIIYVDFIIPLDDFTLEEFYYINLFTTLILENRTRLRSEEDFMLMKEKYIGKMDADVGTYRESDKLNVLNKYNAGALFILSIHMLNQKCGKAMEIAMEALKESDFSNQKKVIEILNRFIVNHKTKIREKAESIVSNFMKYKNSSDKYIKNIMYGYENYRKLLEIVETAKTNYSAIENVLEGIRKKLLSSQSLMVNVVGNKQSLECLLNESCKEFKNFISQFHNNIKRNKTIRWNEEIKKNNLLNKTENKSLFVVPTLVNFVGMSGNLFNEKEFLNPSYVVVVAALQNVYLWDVVREKNGAYGVSASLSYDGTLSFLSYRDSNLEKTLEAYRESIKGLREMADKMTDKDLVRYILDIIRKLDKPKRGVELGKTSFARIINYETEEDRVLYRKYIMNTSRQDFYDFADMLERKFNELEKTIVAVTNEEHATRMAKNNPEFTITPLD